ncbi:hypothetical protein MSIMFB_02052 [Mycobacterium simulans]|uniref:Uncharacterized protein n=1 Tax=Mycobacterium simulans TaxID=627089 RepID=A0A7Z7IJA9_9MYCO|nr:hypothetical protein MSIMFB_02052 [Mycobacterium simulans]
MTTVATGCLRQSGLVERRDFNQLNQLDPLHQQLGDTVAAMHHDRRGRVEVDQRDLDLATIARVDGARAVDDRKPHTRRQPRARMNQPNHAKRDGYRNTRPHQGALPRCQLDVFGAVEVYASVAIMSAAGQRKPGVEPDNGQSGRHGATDYP